MNLETIRLATVDDAPSILEIYSPSIEGSPVSFETEIPSVTEIQKRISETLRRFPWLVLEDDGVILGYAYANPFKARAAYAWSVEVSVYVRKNHVRRGVGKRLYSELFRQLQDKGVVNVIGGITLPNESSVALHESFGFVKVAHFKEVGFKLGRWWDVGYWQLQFAKSNPPMTLR